MIIEIIKAQSVGTREGRNGRLYAGVRTEWLVMKDGILLATYPTRREAQAYADSCRKEKAWTTLKRR